MKCGRLILSAGALIASLPGLLAGQGFFVSAATQAAGPRVLNIDVAVGIETSGRLGGRLTATDSPWLTADVTYRVGRPPSKIRLYAFGGAGVRITIGRNADPELSAGVGARLTSLRLLGPFAEFRLRHALRTAEPTNRLGDTVAPNTLFTVTIGLQFGGVR